MSLEDELDAEWRKTYPHRPPHVWGDEAEIIARVMGRRLARLDALGSRLTALEKRLHEMEGHCH